MVGGIDLAGFGHGERELVLADPAGEASFARMRNAPSGTYVAVNLAFSTTAVQAHPRSGEPFVVELPHRDFRVLLSQPMTLESAAQAWFTLVHDGSITLERSGERWTWNPAWVAQPSEAQLLRGARAQVASFDQSRRLIAPVVLELTRATTLLREGAQLDLDRFFAALQVGEQITFDGWLAAVGVDPRGDHRDVGGERTVDTLEGHDTDATDQLARRPLALACLALLMLARENTLPAQRLAP